MIVPLTIRNYGAAKLGSILIEKDRTNGGFGPELIPSCWRSPTVLEAVPRGVVQLTAVNGTS